MNENSVRLRPATLEDRFLIRRWLADPAVQSWWGTAASAEAQITLAMDSTAALPRIVERGGAAIGYAHAVEIGLWAERLREGVPAGAWEVDYFVSSAAQVQASLGAAVLMVLTEEVFATTLAVACSAVVSIRNETAARAYEQAGFRWLHVVQDPLLGPAWVMLKERQESPQAR
ncbi:MAG: acetyltransferase [Hyphomonadaceae bacterium]|nr:acetyltransferase [Hyphomonadaceae bacterium]